MCLLLLLWQGCNIQSTSLAGRFVSMHITPSFAVKSFFAIYGKKNLMFGKYLMALLLCFCCDQRFCYCSWELRQRCTPVPAMCSSSTCTQQCISTDIHVLSWRFVLCFLFHSVFVDMGQLDLFFIL